MNFNCSRRVFLQRLVAATGILGGFGFGLFRLRRDNRPKTSDRRSEIVEAGLRLETVPVKNPAFLKSSTSEGQILSTRTPNGHHIAFRLDEQSEFVWDRIVNVKEYHQGKRVSVGHLLGDAVAVYGSGTNEPVRQECLTFLNHALESNIILVEGFHVVSKFHERRNTRRG